MVGVRPAALSFYSLGNKTENDTAGCRADYRVSIVGGGMSDLGIRLGVEGEKEFRSALKDIN